MGDVVSTRALNRTLLQRQHLLERTDMAVPAMIEHLVGLQAQDMAPPFTGLWSRLRGFDPATVTDGLDDRSLVRITLMRGTIHLVTAGDALRLRPHFAPELEKIPFRPGFYYGAMAGMDLDEVKARGETIFGAETLTTAELRERIRESWPECNPQAVAQALYYLLPVLQTPPRGTWKNNSRPRWSMIEAWLGQPQRQDYPVEAIVLRYLRAFGPASTMDMQTWSKLTGFREVVERMRKRLRIYRDERGRVLYDDAALDLADPDRPAQVRYLGWYDNVYLSHQDRSRIAPEAVWKGLERTTVDAAVVLVDGFIAGRYGIEASKERAVLRVELHRPIMPAERADLEAEGMALLRFWEPGKDHDIELLTVDAAGVGARHA